MQKRGRAEADGYASPGELASGDPVQFRVQRAEKGFRGGGLASFGRNN